MNKILTALSLACLSLTASAQELQSPNGNLKMEFSLDAQGRPTYYLQYKGQDIIKPSHLGLELKQEDPNKAQDFEFKTRADASKLAQKANLTTGFVERHTKAPPSTKRGNPSGVRKAASATTTTNCA